MSSLFLLGLNGFGRVFVARNIFLNTYNFHAKDYIYLYFVGCRRRHVRGFTENKEILPSCAHRRERHAEKAWQCKTLIAL